VAGVAGRVARPAAPAGAHDRVDPREAAGGEIAAGGVDEVDVEVGSGHRSVVADERREERGVVPRPGADLEDAVAGADVELLEHLGDDRGLRGAAEGHAAGADLGDDHVVGVGVDERHAGQEPVALDAAHGGLDAVGADRAAAAQPVDQAHPPPEGLVAVLVTAHGFSLRPVGRGRLRHARVGAGSRPTTTSRTAATRIAPSQRTPPPTALKTTPPASEPSPIARL
jgi:hypothetical protein